MSMRARSLVPDSVRCAGVAAIAVVLVACGSVPALTAPPVVPAPPAGEPDLSRPERTQMNRELGYLYDQCVERRKHLSEDVDDARGEEAVLGGAAAGAAIGASAAAGENSSANQVPETDYVGDGRQTGNVRHSVAEVELRDAEEHVRAINQALDDLSAFLFAHPDITNWSDAERDRYSALVTQVRRRCRR